MGWTVLYIAFGAVALWLLGEVLLQYKARLRWRLLAFVGFLGVVVGVLMPSVVVIAVGAIAFATGQTYVTLSFRRGFSTGWALGGKPGASKRRRATGSRAAAAEPTLQVSGLEYDDASAAPESGTETPGDAEIQAVGPGVYEPEPMPDDTGQYGVYSEAADTAYIPPTTDDYGFAGYPGYAPQGPDRQAEQQDALHFAYGETGEQRYAAYSDPYIGPQTYGAQPGYDAYADPPPYAPYGGDTYGGGYQDTPPGGVWVPHQRTDEPAPPYAGDLPPEQHGRPPFPGEAPQAPGGPFGYQPEVGGEQQYRY
ncbi:hypothetical protein GPA10_30895 [Streptomyces sp. p1417]|uniref:Uncharacterized protein n=1 Tax=Streptomyces typhae TaxID=2681492 RepID=A0A6L6X5B1_9ACTN|nr:hypothetical protein [Streptomyces typhae]MVO89043.1 hypothetical protein [Streptomyces typhae]